MPPEPAPRVVTVTVSDTRTATDDRAGRALADELAAFRIERHAIVRDDAEAIRSLVREMAQGGEVDAVVLTGGTGITLRDVTVEAVEPLFDRRLDGFGEAFRRLSWEAVGPRAILSRATAGTIGRCVVFVLPGSENAARLGARELVGPILKHAVDLLQGRTHHAEHGKAGAPGAARARTP